MTMADRTSEENEQYGSISPAGKLAASVEILEWTVANFTRPIADERCRDLVARLAKVARKAVADGKATIPADRALLDEMDDISEWAETGMFEIVVSYYLCFDELAPEITAGRFDSILDQCYQSMCRRDEKFDFDEYDDDDSPKRIAIRNHHDAVLQRYQS